MAGLGSRRTRPSTIRPCRPTFCRARDHLHAAAQQFLGLVAEQVADPLRSGLRSVVDMHARGRLARYARHAVIRARHALAPGMIEDEDAGGAGRVRNGALRLRIINLAQLVVVPEIPHGGLASEQRESLAVEGDVRRDRARVVDRYPVGLRRGIGARHANGRLASIVARPLRHPSEVVLRRRVGEYAATVPRFTLYEHAPGATFKRLRSIVGRARLKGIKGVILDYLQLVGGRTPKDTEEAHLREVAQWLADVARQTGLWVLVAAQLNQDGNVRGGEGLRLACDQYYALHRHKGERGAWLEMEESRYTIYQRVGNETAPGLWLRNHGPHFSDDPPPLAEIPDNEAAE
jgi:DnaB-like helicase C terminal domain